MSSEAKKSMRVRILLVGSGVLSGTVKGVDTIEGVWEEFEKAGFLEVEMDDGTRNRYYTAGVGALGEREAKVVPVKAVILTPNGGRFDH